MCKFAGIGDDYGLPCEVLSCLIIEEELVENGKDKDHGLASPWLGLAEQVVTFLRTGDGFSLHLARPFKIDLLDDATQLFFEIEIIPRDCAVRVIAFVGEGLDFLVWAVVAEVHCFNNCRLELMS